MKEKDTQKKEKKFEVMFQRFMNEKNPELHKKAIVSLLSSVDLVEPFLELLDKKDGVERFFLLWVRAGKEEADLDERKSLKMMGASSKKLYEKKDYRKLCEFFYDIVFQHVAEFLRLREREDFETITDHDLYTKEILPPEIYWQYFLLETFAQMPDFDWERGEEIARQNLGCFIVCFGDIYDFFHEQGEDDDFENEPLVLPQKIGRNDPCPCDSGKKWKKCCGK